MCGVIGVVASSPVNQLIYDALLLLQHRGQDAAGMVTANGKRFFMHKNKGMVRDVFRTRNMRDLLGNSGIGHVRYPTAGNVDSLEEAQPLYVNAPYGLVIAHNGNVTNTEEIRDELFRLDKRHINTGSDSEALLNVLAHELDNAIKQTDDLTPEVFFDAMTQVNKRVLGAYACVGMVARRALFGFRDLNGIRPLVLGERIDEQGNKEYMLSSESVALEGVGYKTVRDIAPGEAIWIGFDGEIRSRVCVPEGMQARLNPCLFEYVYFARPDSVIDGTSVYSARLAMGETLADKIRAELDINDIDVVMPIPDTSRPCAMQLAMVLGLPYREGFIKNRYIGRTFIMPGQETRKKSVRQKLTPMPSEFNGKNVLLVDDSIVRGTTSREIVALARESGAKKVYFASAAPAVKYPNVYGIDMPTRTELIAHNKDADAVSLAITADKVIYQDLSALEAAVCSVSNGALMAFDASCFNGEYITGDIDMAYLDALEQNKVKAVEAKSV
ncbi:Amidophosphoribosyltransferase [Ephemeroptericola cinctiostellae]|uniref:Amidophosphoribosyltransferase n=1 Tax=Ephemeroptericola cinctiostellae TaxID=2268024 RepID=A0A345DC39_9BURK|nr:amidophosphoribosyltransferase [Ephemeroptericola cinctiostellae]AXF85927.1 Amidophosphoribosyltransferase [Ephemeroptericola cinctiostellae]